jgi:2-haloacid dehalogenase
MINTIVFDLGGVLIDWNPDYVYRNVFPTEEEKRWFFENLCTPDWYEEQDSGRPLQAATDELVKQFPGHEENIRRYYGQWIDMLGGPIHGTVDILRNLKENTPHKLYALTNWSAETFPVALDRYDFLHWFHGRVVSGEEKTRKPYKVIYETLINRFGIDPYTAIYVDDNQRNLVPAKELGFNTIHFQSAEQFEQELREKGALGVNY